MSLKNKVVMITGASKGLGRALTLAFAKEGAKLAICARGLEKLNAVKEEALALGAEVLAFSVDTSSTKDVDRFVSITETTFGKVDVLINNASIFGPGPLYLADYPERDFEEVVRVNILNPFFMTKRVLPVMFAQGGGSIINVTSEAGRTGFAEWGAYGISKFGVEGMTQTWADELKDTGIRINAVDPGEMDTEMHRIAVPDCDYDLANPNDVVGVFLYLSSDKSIGLNGQRFEAQAFKGGEGLL
ncbi:YciK family oxidoreductase [Bacillus carboniphilus]|uniref:YciK family oxidoreductase n=1 Tax=Bacillus carboniphilus TaxID=86663 RepID=A0ABP3GA61_9BACI